MRNDLPVTGLVVLKSLLNLSLLSSRATSHSVATPANFANNYARLKCFNFA